MKILLKGYYGFGNLGDDVLMLVSYKLLREMYPAATITVFSNNTLNNKNSVYPKDYNNYIIKLLGEEVNLIDWTDKSHFNIVVYGGGGHYFDHATGSRLLRLINPVVLKIFGLQGLSKLEKTGRRILRKPLNISVDKKIGIGIGIGKFTNGSKSFLRQMSDLGSYNYLWVRDSFSITYLKKYFFKRELNRYTDLAFLSKYWNANAIIDQPQHPTQVGVVLMHLGHKESSFYTQLKKFIKIARDRGYVVSLFIFDEMYDKPILSELLAEEIIVWQPNKMSLDSFLSDFKKCQITISLRAHGAILSGILGIVPICIESSLKLREVAKMFPKSAKLLSTKSDAQVLLEAIDIVSMDYENYRKYLMQDLDQNAQEAKSGVKNLKIFLR